MLDRVPLHPLPRSRRYQRAQLMLPLPGLDFPDRDRTRDRPDATPSCCLAWPPVPRCRVP